MHANVNRRNFIKSACLAPFCAAAQERNKWRPRTVLKVSLNAYSFNKLLNDSIRGRGEGITLLQVLDFAAMNRFDGFDLGIGISGTGLRNNFTTSDKTGSRRRVKHIKEWVEVAARLGAPVVRVFAGTQMRSQTWETVAEDSTRDQVQEWIAAALSECAAHGKQHGVRIGVQNHGDFLKTGEELLNLVKAVGSDWCSPIVDTGYFKTKDPYEDIALVAPHALNWQIKQSPFGEDSEIPTDLPRLMTIIRKSGYSGYLPIETLSPRGKPYDPYTVVPQIVKQVRSAMAQTAAAKPRSWLPVP